MRNHKILTIPTRGLWKGNGFFPPLESFALLPSPFRHLLSLLAFSRQEYWGGLPLPSPFQRKHLGKSYGAGGGALKTTLVRQEVMRISVSIASCPHVSNLDFFSFVGNIHHNPLISVISCHY